MLYALLPIVHLATVHLGPVAHGALVGALPGSGTEPGPDAAQGARVGTEPSVWGGAAEAGFAHGAAVATPAWGGAFGMVVAGALAHGARVPSCGTGRLVGAPLVFPLTEMV
jgi:hypothetical protein